MKGKKFLSSKQNIIVFLLLEKIVFVFFFFLTFSYFSWNEYVYCKPKGLRCLSKQNLECQQGFIIDDRTERCLCNSSMARNKKNSIFFVGFSMCMTRWAMNMYIYVYVNGKIFTKDAWINIKQDK